MTPLEVAHAYFDAWNGHDPPGILALFAERATYLDPATESALTGEAILTYAGGLFTAFPDLRFEVTHAAPAGENTVAAQWRMQGTQQGPMAGLPPSGCAVTLDGADFIVTEGDRIRSVRGYFDQKEFTEQLGLRVIIQPPGSGPVRFGTSVYVQSGDNRVPGAISLTALQVRSDEEVQEVSGLSQQITREVVQMPGFISALFAVVGHRMFTVTAWADAESPAELLKGGTHREAMKQFFGPDLSQGGQTSVWVPERLNAMWVRCPACDRMGDYYRQEARCACGERLPDPPPYL